MEDFIELKEVIHSSNDLISEISHHPAIIRDEIMKKGDSSEMMDVVNGDLLDQIDTTNRLVAEIDANTRKVYNSVKSSYSRRFPELKVPDPLQYIMTVQLLGNKPNRVTEEATKEKLGEVLDPKMHLLVTMSAATTQGIKIEPEEMEYVLRACAVAVHMSNLKAKLISFVELNMATIAPNLSVIVGAPIAAKLMGLAGGLTQLATMPSCNVPILGSHKVSNIETDINAPPRVGLLYECDLIQQIPFDNDKDLRRRAVKWIANKCVLAARCDLSQSSSSGDMGQMFRDKIVSSISKELEPPPKKAARPLPAPIEKSGKKRGGRRVRRMKERYAQTELRKAANRMNFGDVGDDAYQNDLGFDRSQLNAIQKLRGPQINEKTRIRLSKGAQKKLAAQNQAAKNMNNQIQESTSITLRAEQQGLQIFNPEARESDTAGTSGENSKYFSNSAPFCAIKREHQ